MLDDYEFIIDRNFFVFSQVLFRPSKEFGPLI